MKGYIESRSNKTFFLQLLATQLDKEQPAVVHNKRKQQRNTLKPRVLRKVVDRNRTHAQVTTSCPSASPCVSVFFSLPSPHLAFLVSGFRLPPISLARCAASHDRGPVFQILVPVAQFQVAWCRGCRVGRQRLSLTLHHVSCSTCVR